MKGLINILQLSNFSKTPLRISFLVLMFSLFIATLLIGQGAEWTGNGNGTDWDDASNWSFSGSGSLTNINTRYTIPDNTTGPSTASGSSLQIKSVTMKIGASATVPSGFFLDINARNTNTKNIINRGTFIIAAGATVDAHNSKALDALHSREEAVVTRVNGTLNIYDMNSGTDGADGIWMEGGDLEISGSVNISDIDTKEGEFDGPGIRAQEDARVIIKTNGTLTIDNCPKCTDGLLILDPDTRLIIETNGTCTVDGVTLDGIWVGEGRLNNSGTINISNTIEDGIYVDIDDATGRLTNNASGVINFLTGIGDECISNYGRVTNNGTIDCNDPADNGINGFGSYTNSGTFNITSPGNNGILLEIDDENPNANAGRGDFTNNAAGTLVIQDPYIHGISGAPTTPFNNQGILEVTSAGERFLNVCSFNNSGTIRGERYIDMTNGTLQSSSTLEPKALDGTPSNIILSGDIDLSGVTINIDIETPTDNDLVSVTGSATYSNATTINVTASANYPLFFGKDFNVVSYSTITGTPSFTYDNCCIWNREINNNQTIVRLAVPTDYIWTGAVSTDWNVAGNWSLGYVPYSGSRAIIPDVTRQPIIFNGTPDGAAYFVEVETGASLTIQSDKKLTIDGGTVGLFNKGEIDNSGTIELTNLSSVGIDQQGIIWNRANAIMNIDNTGSEGIRNSGGSAEVNNQGTINIDNTDEEGIYCLSSSSINNENTINIGLNGGTKNIGDDGLFVISNAVFSNWPGSQLHIQNTDANGVLVSSQGKVASAGIIKIDYTDDDAILNTNTFDNDGGQIFIGTIGGNNSIGSEGLENSSGGIFTNKDGGEITIQNTGSSGLRNSSTFNNNACSYIYLLDRLNNSSGTFNNSGLFQINTNDPNVVGTFINNGIVEDIQGTLAAVTNNEIEIAPTVAADCQSINPALLLGGTVDFNIQGIFSDANATISAGNFTVATNTFVPSPALDDGTFILYVKIENSTGGCTEIIPWVLTVSDCCPLFVTCYEDTDGDNYGDPANSMEFCQTCGSGYVLDNTDCDPNDGLEFPGQTWYEDADNDNYTTGTTQTACNRPSGYKAASELVNTTDIDCDDNNAAVNPNPDCSSTTRTWTGLIDTDWNTACNWTPNCIPTANDDVIIPDVVNDPLITNTVVALAKSVEIQSNALLTINNGGGLTIDNSSSSGMEIKGTCNNDGTINIGQNGGPDNIKFYGIDMHNGSLSNTANGQINIDNTGAGGIDVFSSNLLNLGNIALGQNGSADNIGGYGIQLGGTLDNNGGNITLDNIEFSALNSTSGANYQNNGTINIGQNGGAANISENGIQHQKGSFTNQTNGIINIDNAQYAGLVNNKNFFNEGAINIGMNGGANNIGREGVQMGFGNFTNRSTGILKINQTTDQAFSHDINSQFTNENCGQVLLFKNLRISSISTSFINNGLIKINTSENHEIDGPFTNNGIIEDVQGGLTGVTNNEIIVAPVVDDCDLIEPSFQLGTTIDFTILGIYTDANATTSAGTYSVATNTFTPGIADGQHTLYVEIEDGPNSCTRIVSWSVDFGDDTDPVPACKSNTPVSLESNGSYTILETDVFSGGSDNCGTVNFVSAVPSSVGCSDAGNTVNITVTVNDGNGNENTCTATVDVSDDEQPTLTCPDNVDVGMDAGACGAVVTWTAPTAADNCNASFATSQTMGDPSGTLFAEGTYTIEYTATDPSDNTETCSFTVTIQSDVEKPTLTCPDNVDVGMDAGECGAVVNWTAPTASDNCNASFATTQTMGDPSGTLFAEGTYTIEYTATDPSNNTETCSFTVTIQPDVEKPTLTCPDNVDVGMDAGECGAVVSWATPTAADNCNASFAAVQTMGDPSGTLFAEGTYTIEYTATDPSDNTETCSFTVTVQPDGEIPTLTCPDNVDVGMDAGECGAVVTWTAPTGADNCNASFATVQTMGAPSGTLFAEGTYTIEYTATDPSNNTETCSFTITIQPDAEKPTLTCPDNVDVGMDAGECGAVVNWTAPTASDNCNASFATTQTMGDPSGTLFAEGIHTIEYTATDPSNNTETCSFTITIQPDTEKPTLTCPDNVNIGMDAGACGAVVTWATPTAADNCNASFAAVQTMGDPSGTLFAEGTYTIEYTATDPSSNSETCSFTITVQPDVEAPIPTCTSNVTVFLDANGSYAIQESDVLAGGTDNCGTINYVGAAPATVDCFDIFFPPSITVTVNDGNGNEATCTTTINVDDNTPPEPTCLNPTVVLDATGHYTLNQSEVLNGGFDNCSTINFQSMSPERVDCDDAGSIVAVTVTVFDFGGNLSTCTANVSVQDNELPQPICLNPTVSLNTLGSHTLSESEIFGGGTDNCGPVTFVSMSQSSVDCNDIGPAVNVTVTAEDASGNQNTCTASVTVIDDAIPIATCQDLTIELDIDGNASIDASEVDNGSTDNCGIASSFLDITNFSCSHIGSNTIILTVEDVNGNFNQCDAAITVEDNIAPDAKCVSNTINVALNSNGEYSVNPDDLNDGSNDACGIQSISASPNLLDCQHVGSNLITLTVTDENGNASTCTSTVEVAAFITIDDIIENPESCAGAGDGSLAISATTGGGQVGYSIDGGANFQFNNVFNSLTPGTYVIVVKAFGIPAICEATATANIGAGGQAETWYRDLDGDGHSDGMTIIACSQPANHFLAGDLQSTDGDCNDNDPNEYPGQTWYEDLDGDGHSSGTWLTACQRPAGCYTVDELSATSGDCNDSVGTIYPGATEICNGLDDDCDGEIDEGTSGGLIWTGNIAFYTQAQVDAFSQCYSVIDGNVNIIGANITNLANLFNLEEITGDLTVQNTGMTNTAGLDNLMSIGGSLTIYFNSSLLTLDGLDVLGAVGGNLSVYYNFSLSDGCAIYNLINGGVTGTISIFFNATGCNSVAEINTNCGPNNLVSNHQEAQIGTTNANALAPDQRTGASSFNLFPNPATSHATIQFEQDLNQGIMKIFDLSGRIVLERDLAKNTERSEIDLTGWRPGTYIIQLELEGMKLLTKKLIVIENR
ncbi:MAG: HYR domain-containing protein [Bacteroidota bacterium]